MRHNEPRAPVSFWQRLFRPKGQTLYDKLRNFGHVLNKLLAVPPMMLSPADIAAIGADVNQVVERAEQEIERNDTSSGEPLQAFAPAIYTIRDRYERIYRRGAAKAP